MNWVKNALGVEKPEDDCLLRDTSGAYSVGRWHVGNEMWTDEVEYMPDRWFTHFAVITEPDDG